MHCQKFIFTFSLGVFFLLLLFYPMQAKADGSELTISPTVIRIQAKPPADVWTPFTIENNSNQPISLKIGYKTIDPAASGNGTVVFSSTGQNISGEDRNIFEKMQIVDDQDISHDSIDIGPKESQRFRFRIRLPENEPTSDYYFSLIFLQSQSKIGQSNTKSSLGDQKSFSSIQTGIGLNVLLSVGDKEAPQASIDDFSSPWFLNSGPVLFKLSIHNSGIHFINPQGIITIKNIFGQTVGKVSVPSSIILSQTSRAITNASTPIPMAKDRGLLWPENFLLGLYAATLTVTLSNNGPVYTRTVHFIALPIELFIQILIIFLLAYYIFLRVKSKLR